MFKLAIILAISLPCLIIAVPTTTPGSPAGCSPCPTGWDFYNGYCYHVKSTEKLRVRAFNKPRMSMKYELNCTCLTQDEAQKACEALGANLASIHDEKENKFVRGLLTKWYYESDKSAGQSFYIGLEIKYDGCTQKPPPIEAKYTDGSNVTYGNPTPGKTPAGTEPWGDGQWMSSGGQGPEPNNYHGDENCVYMPQNEKVNGDWADIRCNATLGHICKKPVIAAYVYY